MLQLIPCTSLAARPGSVSLAWLVPANTSISPDVTSRMCTITGPAGLASPAADPAGRAGRRGGRWRGDGSGDGARGQAGPGQPGRPTDDRPP